MRILECFYPAMFLPLAGPLCYCLVTGRDDSRMLPLFFAGLIIAVPSAVSRALAMRAERAAQWFVPTAAAVWLTAGAAVYMGRRIFSGSLSVLYLVVTLSGTALVVFNAARLRMREKTRERARAERDESWTEKKLLFEKPVIPALIWHVLVYAAGLMTACPPLCDLALFTGILYLIFCLVYRTLETTGSFFKKTEEIANVPRAKISRMRRGFCLILVLAAGMASAPAAFSRNRRTYSDIRTWEFRISADAFQEMQQVGARSDTFERLLRLAAARHVELPVWLKTAGELLSYLIFIGIHLLVLHLAVRAVGRYFLAFRGAPEENGDLSEPLDADTAESLSPLRVTLPGRRLSEREEIRREYRRAIRRYRKGRPAAGETPSEIEAETAFPRGMDTEGLHERYEKARYGRSE